MFLPVQNACRNQIGSILLYHYCCTSPPLVGYLFLFPVETRVKSQHNPEPESAFRSTRPHRIFWFFDLSHKINLPKQPAPQSEFPQYMTSVMKLFTDKSLNPLWKYRVPQKGSLHVGCLKPFSCTITGWKCCTLSEISQSNSMVSSFMGLSSSYEKSLHAEQFGNCSLQPSTQSTLKFQFHSIGHLLWNYLQTKGQVKWHIMQTFLCVSTGFHKRVHSM